MGSALGALFESPLIGFAAGQQCGVFGQVRSAPLQRQAAVEFKPENAVSRSPVRFVTAASLEEGQTAPIRLTHTR